MSWFVCGQKKRLEQPKSKRGWKVFESAVVLFAQKWDYFSLPIKLFLYIL